MHNPDAPNWLYGVQAVAVAQYATAHNDGKTVLEWHVENGIVDLKMSSWPRAKEAMQAFLDEGWETMIGANDMGQWIHVRAPRPHPPCSEDCGPEKHVSGCHQEQYTNQ